MRRVPLRQLMASGMREAKIRVPDSIWKHKGLDEGAKLLWCYLRIVKANQSQFTFRELRQAIGICQNSLLKYLRQLEETGWVRWTRESLRRITCICKPIWQDKGPFLLLSSDLLFDNRLSNQSRWLWGAIQRQDSAFTYETLEKETGYCRESLIKYLGQLRKYEWLPASAGTRVNRRTTFAPGVVNPLEAKRN